jgi:hypothetical protein
MEGVVNYPRSKTPSIALYFTSIPLNDPSSVKLQSEKRKADRSMHDRSFQIPASSTTLRRESFYPRTIREIFTGASKNRLYHLFQLADEDLEGSNFQGSQQWQRWLTVNSIPV